MTFPEIMPYLKEGRKAKRAGWNYFHLSLVQNYFEISNRGLVKLSANEIYATDWELIEEE